MNKPPLTNAQEKALVKQLTKQAAALVVEAMLAQYVAQHRIAQALRKTCSEVLGDEGFPNNYPISGGICEHWPREVKDLIFAHVHEANKIVDDAQAIWVESGKYLKTFNEVYKKYNLQVYQVIDQSRIA